MSQTPNQHKPGDIPEIARVLLTVIRANQVYAYRLKWCGTKIPRGTKVDGAPISWTQHGCVYTDRGAPVGFYVRLKEFDGDNHDEHEMIISTNFKVDAGPNQEAELIRALPISSTTQN
jgi:hypothetical protein